MFAIALLIAFALIVLMVKKMARDPNQVQVAYINEGRHFNLMPDLRSEITSLGLSFYQPYEVVRQAGDQLTLKARDGREVTMAYRQDSVSFGTRSRADMASLSLKARALA